MEGELRDAVALYEENLAAVRAGLDGDPGNEELQQLLGELEEALTSTQQALAGLQGGHQQQEQQPGQQEGQHAEPAQPQPQPAALFSATAAAATGDAAAAAAVPETGPLIGPAAGPQPAPARGAAAAAGRPQMHPRNKYATELPDFAALAEVYPSLAPFLQRRGPEGSRATINFTSQEACRELTRVLLKHDYGIEWWVPLGQLVPPVTNRANYIHWLEDLLALSAPPGAAEAIVGLDIGCGANLIYPLLGAALNGWRFVGVDVTEVALQWAERNRAQNPHLAPLIELRRAGMQPGQGSMHSALAQQGGTAGRGGHGGGRPAKRARREQQQQDEGGPGDGTGEGSETPLPAAAQQPGQLLEQSGASGSAEPGDGVVSDAAAPCSVGAVRDPVGSGILSGAMQAGERFAFCMCNPPFFESMAEAGRNPSTAFAGTAEEMVYPGGELAFVEAMIEDSVSLQGAVHWYSTMVGKKSTLKAARALLYRLGVKVLRTTEFVQGKTSRWAIAWSFTADPSTANKPLPRPPPLVHPAV